MPLGMEVDLGPGDFVFDGDRALLRKKGTAPTQFLTHVYCGQTAGWIKMPLGAEVGLNLGPGDFVLDGVPAPPKRDTAPSSFRSMSIVAKRLMDQGAIWYGGRARSRPHCVRWRLALRKGAQQPPLFGQCLLWPNGRPSRQQLSSCYLCYLYLVPQLGVTPVEFCLALWRSKRVPIGYRRPIRCFRFPAFSPTHGPTNLRIFIT